MTEINNIIREENMKNMKGGGRATNERQKETREAKGEKREHGIEKKENWEGRKNITEGELKKN